MERESLINTYLSKVKIHNKMEKENRDSKPFKSLNLNL